MGNDPDDFVNSKIYKGLMEAARLMMYDQLVYGQSKEMDFYLTEEDWMEHDTITEEQILRYPAAKKAAEVKNSPLYKAMK